MKGLFLAFCICLLTLHSCKNINQGMETGAELRELDGRLRLFIDGNPVPPFAYMSYLGEEQYYREAASAGIHLYCFPAYLGDQGINAQSGIGAFRKNIWVGETEFDYSSIEEDFEKIQRADPLAKVIIRLHLDPPAWWEKNHPEELCMLPDGENLRHSFHSKLWKKEAENALRIILSWLLDSDYSHILAGIHVAAGSTEEWFYHLGDYFHDGNPQRQKAFREWLRSRYEDDERKLQEVWNNKAVTFSAARTADISGKDMRMEWRDPLKERNVLDTYAFHTETMVDHIADFCRIVKEESEGKLLTGAFYGYHYFVGDPRRGHGSLEKLLDCPDLDYLSSPNAYNRVMGEDWPPMAATASVKRHGKLWLAENDTRTSATTLLKDQAPGICPPGQYESGVWLGPPDLESSLALLWKNTGRMLACDYGGWWFDMWGGWFSHPEFMKVLASTQELYLRYPTTENPVTKSEICVLVDEELSFLDASFGRLSGEILSNAYPLARSGAPYDLFLRADADLAHKAQYRLIWFMGYPDLSDEDRDALSLLNRNGKTVIWTDTACTRVYPPGSEEPEALNQPVILKQTRFTNEQLRRIWMENGIHLYLESDDVLYAGNNWICIHSLEGGKRSLNLNEYCGILDPIKDSILSEGTSELDLELPPKSTTILRLFPTEGTNSTR